MKRLRSLVTTPAHALDHAIGRRLGRRQVIFDSRLPVHFIVVRPVLEALARHPEIDVWLSSAEGREDTRQAFAEFGMADRELPLERCIWRRFDLYMNGDPWCVSPFRRVARWLNFFHGVAGKYDLDDPPQDSQLFEPYDRVAFVNSDRMQRYLRRGIVTPKQAALVGYPKLDPLVNRTIDALAVRTALALPADRPTVLYAPTWSSASSLHVAGEAIIETLLENGCNVIAKLHDNCFLKGDRFAGQIDWGVRLQRFDRSPAFRLPRTADSNPLMAAADLVITDHSSIGFEAFAVDLPVIVFEAPDLARHARINPEKVELLRSASDVVRSAAELPDVVSGVLAAPARRAAERLRVAADMFYEPGRATTRAANVICELLELSPAPALMAGAAIAC
jgi:hypothetical protein